MAAYKDRFVCAVKVGGRILREKDGRVVLPYLSEYSLLLKNLESRKASVKVSIDGKDVLNGKSLILQPNSSMELERFIEDSLDHGNRFRFIQKTQEIVDHRGDRIDDGMIRVEFAFEQVTKHVNVIESHYHYDHCHHVDHWHWYPNHWYGTYYGMTNSSGGEVMGESQTSYYSSSDMGAKTLTANAINLNPDEGITVKGSESQQQFHQGWIGQLDPSEVIIIRLSGEMVSGKQAEKPIFVKDKFECVTCGTLISSLHSYCEKCGTAVTMTSRIVEALNR